VRELSWLPVRVGGAQALFDVDERGQLAASDAAEKAVRMSGSGSTASTIWPARASRMDCVPRSCLEPVASGRSCNPGL
jgi:hypothetical protein